MATFGAKQVWHALAVLAHSVLFAARGTLALSETTTAFYPPSSNVTGVGYLAALFMTSFPILALPVNSIWVKRIFEKDHSNILAADNAAEAAAV
jgi:hypothetical protein